MPLLRVNLTATGPRVAGSEPTTDVLERALAQLPPDAPVIVLIHGYKFSPRRHGCSPHRHILALDPRRRGARVVSWPRHMGFGKGDAGEGLCLAVGWEGRGTIWGAYAEAGRAARGLAALIAMTRERHAGEIGILAHSLGARVALGALHHLPARSLGRIVLLSGAEFRDRAARALDTPAGRTAEVVNITSRENDLFDWLLEVLVRPLDLTAATIGQGLKIDRANWLDIQIDDHDTRAGLAALGFRLPAPARRICHWSGYLRPGMFALHRALIRSPRLTPLPVLRAALPDRTAPRWSRLLAVSRWLPPLPSRLRMPF